MQTKCICFFIGLLSSLPLICAPQVIDQQELDAIATDAYIYGYPLVTMDMTKRVLTNVPTKEGKYAPMGEFANLRTYPNASFKDVTAPNADTLYSMAFLDLVNEPYVFHIPDEDSRYYLMPMLSGWTNVFESPGTRTTGTKEQNYLICGPKWYGAVPEGLTLIKAPTNLVWILGRTYCTGTQEDYAKVHALQDKYSLTPLSFYGKSYTPPKGKVDPSIDMVTPVRDQVNKMDGVTFFQRFTNLMKDNPPASIDKAIVEKMKKIGIEPGKEIVLSDMSPEALAALSKAPKLGQEKIIAFVKNTGRKENEWQVSIKFGTYGISYLQRAAVAVLGLGANLPEDAIYPLTTVDGDGNPLNGKNRYVLHFEKGEIPPVKGFWSLTMYNDQFFFYPNPLNRYTLSPRNPLQYNPDGSLDLYIQNTSPGNDKDSNWLPCPKENFVLMLRLYWPDESVLHNKWNPPPVKKIT